MKIESETSTVWASVDICHVMWQLSARYLTWYEGNEHKNTLKYSIKECRNGLRSLHLDAVVACFQQFIETFYPATLPHCCVFSSHTVCFI